MATAGSGAADPTSLLCFTKRRDSMGELFHRSGELRQAEVTDPFLVAPRT